MFEKLVKLGIINQDGNLKFNEYLKLKSGNFMDLNIDHLSYKNDDRSIVISLAHNYIQNGDVMADPDMEIRIIPSMKMVEALTFKQDSIGIYQQVYLEDGRFNPTLKNDLNNFLNFWLKNLIEQGFSNY
jgi:predicted metalloenzyme YecM